ncbi:dynamin family protein [Halobacillus sp. A5]|uniref:dynamin family protein n=1 Tax=Halobacillus sp. A5 TaxID=2880263 RepID=UPI0020A650BB|nr:dynamin family protein [Halobacillus sp. A5]MCP3025932.1 dynamin family protein [Halobacillus sp. A5]
MSVIIREKRDTALKEIAKVYEKIEKNHPVPAEKTLDLAEKADQNEVVIGFAGHFSAGKSSMINYLTGEDVLPSSPIPTSANIVKLSSGDPFTTVFFKEKSAEKYLGAVPIETIRRLCKDGETISGIEISREIPALPDNVKLIDTPGVDSTNDADRVITESALHVMDHMYYVMDYNHVQSEVNLNFLLEMQKRNISFSIIINQVDKHREEELPFYSFSRSVSESLQLWGIQPDDIFYTSLKKPVHSYSEVDRLQSSFSRHFQEEDTVYHASQQLERIIDECKEEYREQFEDELNQIDADLSEAVRMIETQSYEGIDPLKEKNLIPEAKNHFNDRVKKFISNAYLMPSEVREKAEAYLVSEKADFKVGLIFSGKKTEEERVQRKEAFVRVLVDTAEKNLVWPLRERVNQFLEEYEISNDSLVEDVQKLTFSYPVDERISTLIEPGASVTGEYVLRYTDQLAKDIQKFYRGEMEGLRQSFEEELLQSIQLEAAHHKELFEAIEEKGRLETRRQIIEEEIAHYINELLNNDGAGEEKRQESILTAVNQRLNEIKEVELQTTEPDLDRSSPKEKPDKLTPQKNKGLNDTQEDELEEKINKVSSILKGAAGFNSLLDQLKEKQDRLVNKEYTIALFGAFSAGKSSFANAILGDNILPVSPNPMTATINKITKPTDGQSHQTVLVKVKAETELLDDLKHATEDNGNHFNSLQAAYSDISQWKEGELEQLNHKNRSFIQAFLKGYSYMNENIGIEMQIEWNQLASFVSNEETSCFIEWVEIFFDCEWTRKGVTLVDTPGADSVNARHTNVSFEYIKNADAILFVTYYNHPFSKADESFLKQLGRVKDAFSMDKMFFIINASDLADSQDEKEQVEEYVTDQLQAFQIRKPRLFSLSSLNGLKNKLEHKTLDSSGLALFEEEFEIFLKDELTQVLKHSIQNDFDYACRLLQSYINNAAMDEQQREQQLNKLYNNQLAILPLIHERSFNSVYAKVEQKVEKQLFYAHERMMLNFTDFFKNHINPSVISGSHNQAKDQLKSALKPMLNEIDFEMNQELRAISLRMEGFVEQLLNQTQKEVQTAVNKYEPELSLSNREWSAKDGSVMQFNETVPVDKAELNQTLKLFKGTKSFFEGNEKVRMKDQMAQVLQEPLKVVIMDSIESFTAHSQNLFNMRISTMKDEWSSEINQYFENQKMSLREEVNSEDLYRRLEQLNRVV